MHMHVILFVNFNGSPFRRLAGQGVSHPAQAYLLYFDLRPVGLSQKSSEENQASQKLRRTGSVSQEFTHQI